MIPMRDARVVEIVWRGYKCGAVHIDSPAALDWRLADIEHDPHALCHHNRGMCLLTVEATGNDRPLPWWTEGRLARQYGTCD